MKVTLRLTISKALTLTLTALILLSSVQSLTIALSSLSSSTHHKVKNQKVFSTKESTPSFIQFWIDEQDDSTEDDRNCGALITHSVFGLHYLSRTTDSRRVNIKTYPKHLFFLRKAPIWLEFRSIRI